MKEDERRRKTMGRLLNKNRRRRGARVTINGLRSCKQRESIAYVDRWVYNCTTRTSHDS